MKQQSNGLYILKLTVTLFLITAIVAGLLGFINYITADKIAAGNAEKTDSAMKEVLTAENYSEVTDFDSQNGIVTGLWAAESAGYVAECTVSGSQGNLVLMVGVREDGTVSGVSVISHSETAGLGANAAKSEFTSQFIGKSGTVSVTKDGGEIDALTGATITSRAVCSAVSAATACVSALG